MQVIDIKKRTFRQAESEWFDYHKTLNEISILKESIVNPFVERDENVGGGQGNIPGAPTESIATRLTVNKQLNHLKEITDAIEKVYATLPDDYKRLCELRYWRKNNPLDWDGVALDLCISKRQAQRWRDEIINATIKVLGWR